MSSRSSITTAADTTSTTSGLVCQFWPTVCSSVFLSFMVPEAAFGV